MICDLGPAFAFGQCLRENPGAAAAYDRLSPEQKQGILLQLQTVQDMDAFVSSLAAL